MESQKPFDLVEIAAIDIGYILHDKFICFQFDCLRPGQKALQESPWYAIPPDGAKALMAHLASEIARLETQSKSSAPKRH